ncbi:S8 family serine peptidase [Clostridium sp. 'deep sea']|uniref:S8 family serine peptidase n=1 Tax=Clostridium sp. 'deep sea' TaxID=2779445 RepID=UPI00189649CE|nr:S8 family serine peptidase [Clostridium sp. 'deep sea']QOR36122.1 S8 family serine peptidase [Clostridium sp. 'deep sea']
MKKFLCCLLALMFVMTGCKDSASSKKLYDTILENNNIGIVREPSAADYSLMNPGILTELPCPKQDMGIELRSSDLTMLDLRNSLDDLFHSTFDSKTKWPVKLPAEFDPKAVMELGKNPGLNVKKLHEIGITGKGVGIAIIDSCLLVNHIEYKDQLKMYEEIQCRDIEAEMHGPAVASIAVGETVGVAPEADLYYIACKFGERIENNQFEHNLTWVAQSIDRIVEVNKLLPKDKKIRVISISLGINSKMKGYQQVVKSIADAKHEKIYTVHVESNKFLGLGREPLLSADEIASYTKAEHWKHDEFSKNTLWIPMDSRCTASPTGDKDYVFYSKGGLSWSVPYVAGLYALACQVKPDIIPELFWLEAFETSDSLLNKEGVLTAKIVNPGKLIDNVSKLQLGK